MIELREIQKSDLPAINSWRNDKTLIDSLGANFLFIAPVIDEKWFEQYLSSRDKAVRLAIIDKQSLTIVGCVYLTDIHRINRSAEFSIFLGNKDYMSRGYGEMATRAMLTHGFDDLNLHRIHLSVLARNERAQNLYRKVGFREEGRLRDAVFKHGHYEDLIMMSLIAHEFQTASL